MSKLLKVTEQTLWQVVGRIISSAAAFIALALVTRNYDKLEVGAYTLAQTYLTMFFIITDLGLNAYVLTRLKNHPDEANKLLSARFYWSVFLTAVALVLAFILPLGDGGFRLAVLFGLITIIGNGIYNSANLIFQKELRYQISIIASSIGALVMVVSLALLVFSKAPLYLLLIAYSLGWLANNITSIRIVSQFYKFKLLKPDLTYLLNLFKKVWPISATLVLNVIYFRFDAFILASSRGLSEAAIYNLAFSLFQTALFLPTFIMNSYYPIILKELADKKLLFEQLRLAFIIMVGIAVLGTALTFLLSPYVVNLITGGGFDGSIVSINILSLSYPAFFGSSLLMWVYVSVKRYKSLMVIYLMGLLLNILLNFIYTPTYTYVATSWITVSCEYFILTVQIMVLWLHYKKDQI